MLATLSNPDNFSAIYDVTVRAVVALAAVHFAFLIPQANAWGGPRGVYPHRTRVAAREKNFSVFQNLLHFPSQWLGWILGTSAQAVTGYAVIGHVAAVLFVLTGHSLFLVTTWFVHAGTLEIFAHTFPWHSLMGEALFLFVLGLDSLSGLGPIFVLASSSSQTSSPPRTMPVLALRFLAFRCLFGFGKTKFTGSTRKDWLYIKTFLPSIPIPSLAGVWLHRTMPTAFFYLGYLFFFVSEIVTPLFYFVPDSWTEYALLLRTIGAVFTIKLMLGISVTGNFGTFNILLSLIAMALPLPLVMPSSPSSSASSSSSSSSPSSPETSLWQHATNAALALHIASGCFLLLLFNSWTQLSWFSWPALRRPLPNFCAYFELLAEWRVCIPFGIFPCTAFPAQRQMFLFEGSTDGGATWVPYRYKYQPTQATDTARTAPCVHPILDFVMFYQLGYSGFERQVINGVEPVANFHCRPIDAVARNLLEGGDGRSLFASGPARGSLTHIRVVQLQLILRRGNDTPEFARPKCDGDSDGAAARNNWWYVQRGQIELPATSKADVKKLESSVLPPPFIDDVCESSDYTLSFWRRRAIGGSSQSKATSPPNTVAEAFTAAGVHEFKQHQSKHVKQLLSDVRNRAHGISSLTGAVAYFFNTFRHLESDADATIRAIWALALRMIDALESIPDASAECVFNNKTKPATCTHQHVFNFCLWILCDVEKRAALPFQELVAELVSQHDAFYAHVSGHSNSNNNEQQQQPQQQHAVHDGVLLFAILAARTVTFESSLCRRMSSMLLIPRQQNEEEMIKAIPGYHVFFEKLFSKEIAFFSEFLLSEDEKKKWEGGEKIFYAEFDVARGEPVVRGLKK